MLALDPQFWLSRQKLADWVTTVANFNMNHLLAAPGLVIGSTSTAAVKIANTTKYVCGGVCCSKTTAEIAFTAGSASNIATGYETVFALQLNASGTGTLVPGTTALGSGNALYPENPANGYCVIGYVRVYNNTGSAFTAGTTGLDTSGLTVTYYDGQRFPLPATAQ